jgi:hypothetical protein
MMVLGTSAAQSTEPKSQLRPRLVKRRQVRPSVVQPAEPPREKLAILVGPFWSTLVAQPVSSLPDTQSSSIRRQVLPWSGLRHRPPPTTLTVASPLSRFTTTPEQPPGQTSAAPLLVRRASNGLETSVHVSAAWIDAASTPTPMQMHSTNPGPQTRDDTQNRRRLHEHAFFTGTMLCWSFSCSLSTHAHESIAVSLCPRPEKQGPVLSGQLGGGHSRASRGIIGTGAPFQFTSQIRLLERHRPAFQAPFPGGSGHGDWRAHPSGVPGLAFMRELAARSPGVPSSAPSLGPRSDKPVDVPLDLHPDHDV